MKNTKMLLAALGLFVAAPSALAQVYVDPGAEVVDIDAEYQRPQMYSYAWRDPMLLTGICIGLNIGGGVGGFTEETMRDTVDTDIGGLWSARATIGTHIPLGIDLSYVGTRVDVTPLGGRETGVLVGTAVEGALRWNIMPHYSFNPYIFAGLGWQRYDVTETTFSLADTGFADEDDLMIVPMGAGFAFRDLSGLVLDIRGTFRAAEDSSLVLDRAGTTAELHTWEASGSLGYEF